ncbi:hypothetical protein KZC51_09205 [Microbacterium sp. SSW1-49]|uniref:Uncharacterized protein n=1 Tax=Microbacterium croceum TaxID=2851645 RepID=A0ABT0FF87_9MICO|nr:DUF6541 family protein [Microbacterium croceum]MCK2036314.1 hypothetical protein [Microbacterium croceum]
MIVDWLTQTPVLLVAAIVIIAPGAAALYLVGMRGLALLATAPLFSTLATAVIALVLGLVGVPWSPLSWGIAMLLVIVVAALLGRAIGGRIEGRDGGAPRWLIPSALAIGILIGLWRLAAYITDPAGISQTNDAVFHMNAVRFILETADASSLHVNAVIGGSSFYPAAWHALTSLVVAITGTSIPIAANMVTLVIGALIWPLGIAWLTRVVTASGTIAAYAAVLSGALQTFPLLMFQWGVLFPNALSTAMIPAAIAVVISLPAWTGERTRWRVIARACLLILMVAGALALSQPAALLPWAAIVLVWGTAKVLREKPIASRAGRWALVGASWALLAVIWVALARGTSGSHWPPFRGKLEVFLDVLFNGQLRIPFAIGVSILMLAGIVFAWRNGRTRWFVFAWVGISALYVLVAAIGAPLVRVNILGAWYADPYRIAALAPIVVIPLAAIGVNGIVVSLARLRGRSIDVRRSSVPSGGVGMIALTVFMIVLVLVRPVAMPAFLEGTYDRESRYLSDDDTYLSPDERELLESLDDLVEPGARVISNPSTGAGFGYMLSGVDVYPRTWSSPRTDEWQVLANGLRDAGTDSAVCDALHAYSDPEYVLDFGPGESAPGRYKMPGMTDFDGQPGFEEVAAVGDVSLWRITACAR